MRLGSLFGCALLPILAWPVQGVAQEQPVRRMANIVSVAVEEYGKGVDEHGRMIDGSEYQEATDFLRDARGVAERLSGGQVNLDRAVLDSIIEAASGRMPPSRL